ncbi:hypothetical protein [Shinella zoogloeoides]|uniref:hypothetical protein n=1 Tax=Shinella zoogloeoides TaxID=352475 RepID=UPI000E652DC8|nr:hypothetical protein [Shinella zoogloeoides]
MAKTALERKREQLNREASRLRLLTESTYPFLKLPFFQWLDENSGQEWDNGDLHKDASRIIFPAFEDDSGPRSVDGEVERIGKDDPEADPYAGYAGSIGRAERLVDDLLALASIYANTINTYKKEELTARIKEIEDADLSDPDTKKKALADIVRLRKMLERLDKASRISIPEYKIKGI